MKFGMVPQALPGSDRGEKAAVFNHKDIRPALPEPEEFNEFWRRGLAEVAAVPADVRRKRIEALCDGRREVCRISFATVGGGRIYGFLTRPAGPGPFPALVSVPGAGPGTGPDAESANEGFAVLYCNVFPYETTEDCAENERRYEAFNREGLYIYRGAEAPERCLMRSALLGIGRAVEWFAAQPFVDADRIGVFGSSQGGGFALMLAGLVPHFRAAAANVPAFCDFGGEKSGWPQFRRHGFDRMQLFDAAYFAARIQCPVKMIAGWRDEVCPPESVYAAYNCINAPKEIIDEPSMAHVIWPSYGRLQQWLKEELKG